MSFNSGVYQPTTFTPETESSDQGCVPRQVLATFVKATRKKCNGVVLLLKKILPVVYYLMLTCAAFLTGFVFIVIGVRGFMHESSKTHASLLIIMGIMLLMIGVLLVSLLYKYRYFINPPPAPFDLSMNPSNEFLFVGNV